MARPKLPTKLVAMGGIAGPSVCVMYPVQTFVPLPDFFETALFLFFGPLLVLAYVGVNPLLAQPKQSVSLIVASIHGILAGAANSMFSAVHLTISSI